MSCFRAGVFLLLLLFSSVATAENDALRFAPVPLMAEHHVKEQFLPFCQTLSQLTCQDVDFVYKADYEEILSALHRDELDLAYLGPLPYVLCHDQDNEIMPLVRFANADGSLTYTCSLVSFADNPPTPGCNETTIALTQPYSTCGYLATQALLSRYELSLEQCAHFYAGNHEQSSLAVIRGSADFAGVKTTIARQYANLGLTILCESDPVPGCLLVANRRTLGEEKIRKLQQDLLALSQNPTPEQQRMVQGWGRLIRYGMVEACDADYQPIRELLVRFPLPEISP